LFRLEAIRLIVGHAGNSPIVANLGPTSNELWHTGDRERNFYTYGSMGLCSSIALGMALGTRERVISLDGDGSLLMNLGTLATLARERPPNLVIVVFDNEQWAQTGGQPSHTAFGTDLEGVARACGVPRTATVRDLASLERVLRQALHEPGPWVIVAKVEEGEEVPFAPIEPDITLYRFRKTFTG